MITPDNIAPGEIVQHKLQKEWIMVLSHHKPSNIIRCRTKKLEVIECYPFELELVPAHNCRKGIGGNERR